MREVCCYFIFVLMAVSIGGGLQETPMDLFFLEKASSLFADYEAGIEESLLKLRRESLDKMIKICQNNNNERLNIFCLHSLKIRLGDSVNSFVSESETDKRKITNLQSFYIDIALNSNVKNIVILSDNKTHDLVNTQRLLMARTFRVTACLGEKVHPSACLHDSHPKLFLLLGSSCADNILNAVRKLL